MSDLIKREDAIEAIDKMICDNKWVCECAINSLPTAEAVSRYEYERLYAEADYFAKRIRSAESADNWMPVSERLPEESEEVLVTDIWGCIHIESLEVSIENIKYWEDCDGNFDYFDEIIAWKPLPTPYKESEVQNDCCLP